MTEKWIKTLRNHPKNPDTRYRKGAQRNVYDEHFDGEEPWSFRAELYGGSPVERIPDLWLRNDQGFAAAQEELPSLDKCYRAVLRFKKPALREDTADMILDLIPSTFVVRGIARYTLGFESFLFKKASKMACFRCFFADKQLPHSPVVYPYIPGCEKIRWKDPYLNLTAIDTPEWLYDPEAARERQSTRSVQNECGGLPTPGEERGSAGPDVSYSENSFQPTGKR